MDGDSVFNSKEFTDWMKDRGNKIQVTSRDCPQDNGRAERYGRSLVEMARCLLAHSGLPKGFWKNAIECACYIKNRLPHKSISSTPYTLWFGEKPDLSGLRAFGCLASRKPQNEGMRKLDSRGHSCLFMGYDLEHPDYYIVYDRVLRSFIRSPHVVFDETNFLHGARQGGRGSVEYTSDEIDILEGIISLLGINPQKVMKNLSANPLPIQEDQVNVITAKNQETF